MNVDKIFAEIDKSKKSYDFYDMEELFQQFDFDFCDLEPPENIRLSFCYYWSWICTDTLVGIRVWYFDNAPVALSFKPYRKSEERFYWLSSNDFNIVYDYILQLRKYDTPTYILTNHMPDIIKKAEKIDYKKHENLNVKN